MKIRRWGAASMLAAVGVAAAVVVVSGGAGHPATAVAAKRPLTHAEHSALEMSTVAACLRDEGWEIKVDAQGAIESSVGFDEAAAMDAAYQRCDAIFLVAHPRPVMDDAAWTKLYKHQLFLRVGLNEHG